MKRSMWCMICDTFAGISIWVLNVAMRTIVRNHAHATTRRALGFAIEDIEFRDVSQKWLYSPIIYSISWYFFKFKWHFHGCQSVPEHSVGIAISKCSIEIWKPGHCNPFGDGSTANAAPRRPEWLFFEVKSYILHSQLIHLVSSPEMGRLDVYDLLLPTIIVSSSYLPCAGM